MDLANQMPAKRCTVERSPAIYGKTNRIQCACFKPQWISASIISYVRFWAETKR